MSYRTLYFLILFYSCSVFSQSEGVSETPEFQQMSNAFSDQMRDQNPLVDQLLNQMGVQYISELDRSKTYIMNVISGEVSTIDSSGAGGVPPSEAGEEGEFQTQILPDVAFVSAPVTIRSTRGPGGAILGDARTAVTCLTAASQEATVSGFMASQQQRDPIAGVRHGVPLNSDILASSAIVEFDISKLPGGAKNPANRTTMETLHTATCGDDFTLRSQVATWPPLRVDLVLDDTGSMEEELSGVQSALTSFVASISAILVSTGRDTFFEVVSFKDSPTLRIEKTDDTAAVISAVNSLFPLGGDDCPEDSIGALNAALNSIATEQFESDAAIVLATDASPRPDSDIGSVIALAQSLGVTINVLLSGDCVSAAASMDSGPLAAVPGASSNHGGQGRAAPLAAPGVVPSARVVFEEITGETGGIFTYLPDTDSVTEEDFSEAIEKMFEVVNSTDPDPDPDPDPNFVCEQRILSSWGTTSFIEMRVTNVGEAPQADWSVIASYPDGYTVGDAFQIRKEGENPATFSPPAYVESLDPQERHVFLYFVSNGGEPVDATITRCGG